MKIGLYVVIVCLVVLLLMGCTIRQYVCLGSIDGLCYITEVQNEDKS